VRSEDDCMPAFSTFDTLAKLIDEVYAVMRERGVTQAKLMRDLGWGRSRLRDIRRNPKVLEMTDLFRILEVLGVDPQEFLERVHGKASLPADVAKVCEVLEATLKRLDALADEVREGVTAARFAVWASWSLLRPLTEALRAGASARRVEAALAETLGVALAVCQKGLGEEAAGG